MQSQNYFENFNNINNNISNYSNSLDNYFNNGTNYSDAREEQKILLDTASSIKSEINEQKIKNNSLKKTCNNYDLKFKENLDIINAQILGNKGIRDDLATKKKSLELGEERYRWTTHIFWLFSIINIIMIMLLIKLLR